MRGHLPEEPSLHTFRAQAPLPRQQTCNRLHSDFNRKNTWVLCLYGPPRLTRVWLPHSDYDSASESNCLPTDDSVRRGSDYALFQHDGEGKERYAVVCTYHHDC